MEILIPGHRNDSPTMDWGNWRFLELRRFINVQELAGSQLTSHCQLATNWQHGPVLAGHPGRESGVFELEATPRIELGMEVLQTSALPLGYVAAGFLIRF